MTIVRSFHSAPHSMVQSAVAAVCRQSDEVDGNSGLDKRVQLVTAILEMIPHPRHRLGRVAVAEDALDVGGPLNPDCIKLMLEFAWAKIRNDQAEMARIQNVFEKSSCGAIGWLGAAFDYMVNDDKQLTYRQAPTPPDDTYCYNLPEQDTFRIGILGDWGTGEPVAQDVINAMLTMRVDLMIHVGDVYYAGSDGEVRSNYIDMIQNARGATGCNVPIYNMPGNHDYYCKGQPFYNALGSVNVGTEFANSPSTQVPTQEASFFVLRNSWLQLQAMDTGYYDSDLFAVANDTTQLNEPEAAWHLHQLNEAKIGGRSVFLFSHHQPWSRFLGIGNGPGTAGGLAVGEMPKTSYNPNLQAQLAHAPQDVVLAWFWGHEHVLQVYDQAAIAASMAPTAFVQNRPLMFPLADFFPWVPYGACVGFSAFPMLDSDGPYDVAASNIQFNRNYQLGMTVSDGVSVYNHGFTILEVAKGDGGKPISQATYYWLPSDGSSTEATAFSPPSRIS